MLVFLRERIIYGAIYVERQLRAWVGVNMARQALMLCPPTDGRGQQCSGTGGREYPWKCEMENKVRGNVTKGKAVFGKGVNRLGAVCVVSMLLKGFRSGGDRIELVPFLSNADPLNLGDASFGSAERQARVTERFWPSSPSDVRPVSKLYHAVLVAVTTSFFPSPPSPRLSPPLGF